VQLSLIVEAAMVVLVVLVVLVDHQRHPSQRQR